jgi:hypothetical protein
MAWSKNGTPDTLGSSGDVMTISDMVAQKFNVFMRHIINSGAIDSKWEFNANTNSVYAQRTSVNGGADGTDVSQAFLDFQQNGSQDIFDVSYVCSIAGEEKLLIGNAIGYGASGAGTAPNRYELVGKFVPSPDADITRIDSANDSAGSYDTLSNISALGTD